MNKFKIILNGIITENPTFALLLGMCPTLGTTSSAITAWVWTGYDVCSHLLQHRYRPLKELHSR